jgi:hypothetical protein
MRITASPNWYPSWVSGTVTGWPGPGFALIAAPKPTVRATAATMDHHGDRVEKSLMRSAASTVIGSRPQGRC